MLIEGQKWKHLGVTHVVHRVLWDPQADEHYFLSFQKKILESNLQGPDWRFAGWVIGRADRRNYPEPLLG